MSAARAKAPQGTLGTFAGVFTPGILAIILFLRLGFEVGEAGLGRALLILLFANGISVLTSLSLSAVATSLRVKRGGDYCLISHTLGHEFGGAIGLMLFMAQAMSIGFYCIGFAEDMASILPAPLSAHPHYLLPWCRRGGHRPRRRAGSRDGGRSGPRPGLDALGDAGRLAELTANDAETSEPAEREAIDGLTAQLRALEQQAEKARRRAARIAARAGTARGEARALGVLPQEEAGGSGEQA